MPESTRLIAASATALGRVRSLLIRLECASAVSGEPYFGPYVTTLRDYCEKHRMDLTGISAGEELGDLWDRKSRDFIEQKIARLQFSNEEEVRMLGLISEFNDWMARNFPDCDDYEEA